MVITVYSELRTNGNCDTHLLDMGGNCRASWFWTRNIAVCSGNDQKQLNFPAVEATMLNPVSLDLVGGLQSGTLASVSCCLVYLCCDRDDIWSFDWKEVASSCVERSFSSVILCCVYQYASPYIGQLVGFSSMFL